VRLFKRKNHYESLLEELRLYREYCQYRISLGDLDIDDIYYNSVEHVDALLELLGAVK